MVPPTLPEPTMPILVVSGDCDRAGADDSNGAMAALAPRQSRRRRSMGRCMFDSSLAFHKAYDWRTPLPINASVTQTFGTRSLDPRGIPYSPCLDWLASFVAGSDRSEYVFEARAKGRVDIGHRCFHAEICEAGHAPFLLVDPAGKDSGVVRKIGRDVERNSMQRDPAFHADAEGCDLVLATFALVGALHPHADAVAAPFALDVEPRERADNPFL